MAEDPSGGPRPPAGSSLEEALATGRERGPSAVSARDVELLCFVIGEQPYAVRTHQVARVALPGRITQVPLAPPHVRGVFHLHGEVIAIVDVSVLAGRASGQYSNRVVVLEVLGLSAAIPVTRMLGMRNYAADRIEPPPPQAIDFVTGQLADGDDIFYVIDGGALLRQCKGASSSGEAE